MSRLEQKGFVVLDQEDEILFTILGSKTEAMRLLKLKAREYALKEVKLVDDRRPERIVIKELIQEYLEDVHLAETQITLLKSVI